MSATNRMTPQSVSKDKKEQLKKDYEEETDFLDTDRPIPGQNFTCLSFLSPESAIQERYLWYLKEFLQDLTVNIPQPDDMPELEFKTKLQKIVTSKITNNGITNLWDDFVYTNRDNLSKKYDEAVDFQTSTRGLKIRGTYDTYREAKKRSDQIAKFDTKHHVYIAQVGYWLPWDPDPHELPEQEYQEKELNTLMKKYQENLMCKDQFFEERNREKMENALKKNKNTKKVSKENEKELIKVRKTVEEKDKIFNNVIASQRKNNKEARGVEEKEPAVEEENEPAVEEEKELAVEEEKEPAVEEEKELAVEEEKEPAVEEEKEAQYSHNISNENAETISAVFDKDDPWLQRKRQEKNL